MKGTAVEKGVESAIWLVVIYIIAVSVSLFMAGILDESGAPSWSNDEIAKQAFGLESGKEYPLQFGERIAGSSGEAVAHAGFFSASASVSMQPLQL